MSAKNKSSKMPEDMMPEMCHEPGSPKENETKCTGCRSLQDKLADAVSVLNFLLKTINSASSDCAECRRLAHKAMTDLADKYRKVLGVAE